MTVTSHHPRPGRGQRRSEQRPWEPPAAARQRPINHGDDPSLGRRNPAALRMAPVRCRLPPRAGVT